MTALRKHEDNIVQFKGKKMVDKFERGYVPSSRLYRYEVQEFALSGVKQAIWAKPKRDIIHVGGGKLVSGEMTRPHLDTIENMNPACVPCNSNKSSMSLKSWRSLLTHYRDVQLLRDSTHARHLHRFGLIEIKSDPVVFFFEKWGADDINLTR